jgi:hypothetical protein
MVAAAMRTKIFGAFALILLIGAAQAGLLTVDRGGRGAVPAEGGGDPAWFESATSKTWIALDTQLADVDPCPANNCAYSGGEGQDAVTEDWTTCSASESSLYCGPNGGHLGYAGNELYSVNVNTASPAWAMPVSPSTSVQQNVEYYADGKPSSSHNGSTAAFIPDSEISGGRHFLPVMWSVYGNGGSGSNEAVSYEPGAAAYDVQDTFADFPGTHANANEACAVWNPADGKVWLKEWNDSVTGGVRSFDPATNTWSSQNGSWVKTQGDVDCAIDPVQNCLIAFDGSALFTIDLNSPATNPVDITPTGSGPSDNGPGIEYDDVFAGFLVWGNSGATVYTLKKTSGSGCGNTNWAWGALTNGGGGATPTAAAANGTTGRFRLIESPRGLVLLNDVTDDLFFYKLPTTLGNYN